MRMSSYHEGLVSLFQAENHLFEAAVLLILDSFLVEPRMTRMLDQWLGQWLNQRLNRRLYCSVLKLYFVCLFGLVEIFVLGYRQQQYCLQLYLFLLIGDTIYRNMALSSHATIIDDNQFACDPCVVVST